MAEAINELRQEIAALKRRLEDADGREKQLRNESITLEQQLRQQGLEVARLKTFNNNSAEKNSDQEEELLAYREFVTRIRADLGLEQEMTIRDLRAEIVKRSKATMNEALSGDLIVKLRKILDPGNVHEDLVQAAKSVVQSAGSKGASPSAVLAVNFKDLQAQLAEEKAANRKHAASVRQMKSLLASPTEREMKASNRIHELEAEVEMLRAVGSHNLEAQGATERDLKKAIKEAQAAPLPIAFAPAQPGFTTGEVLEMQDAFEGDFMNLIGQLQGLVRMAKHTMGVRNSVGWITHGRGRKKRRE